MHVLLLLPPIGSDQLESVLQELSADIALDETHRFTQGLETAAQTAADFRRSAKETIVVPPPERYLSLWRVGTVSVEVGQMMCRVDYVLEANDPETNSLYTSDKRLGIVKLSTDAYVAEFVVSRWLHDIQPWHLDGIE